MTTNKRRRGGTSRDTMLVAAVPDIHVPFHDDYVCRMVGDFLREIHPDALVFLGDYLDFYGLSNFKKDPDRIGRLQEEIDEGWDLLDDMTYKLTRDRHYTMGNHCDRLRRYLWENAPELSNLDALTFDNLLRLKDNHFEVYDYGETVSFGDVNFAHGHRVSKHSGRTAQFHIEEYGTSVVVGHSHRQGVYKLRNLGQDITAIEAGHLTNSDPEYKKQPVPNWQKGLCLIWIDDETGEFWHDLISIKNQRFSYNGSIYK